MTLTEVQETQAETPLTVEQSDAAVLAVVLRLELGAIDSWNIEEKLIWLKCMLVKHSSLLQGDNVQCRLAQLEDQMRRNPQLSLDALVTAVRDSLGCEVAYRLGCELASWRQAAAAQAPSNPRHPRAVSPHGDLLWQHILRLLMTGDPAVRWQQPRRLGHFQFVRSGAAARSWGRTKNNPNMSFEKMSRSIRQYYRQRCGVIQKVENKARLEYKFNMSHPDVAKFIRENFTQPPVEKCE